MCIRDRSEPERAQSLALAHADLAGKEHVILFIAVIIQEHVCLLYTSDAADERSSVDLGGRRIINKKKHVDVKECVVVVISRAARESARRNSIRAKRESVI